MVPTTKEQAVYIIGDSNLRHLTSKLMSDRKLARLPIRVDAISGRRAGDLSAADVEKAARYRFVILMLGNNDLGAFRDRPAVSPVNVACKLIAFKEVLEDKGCRVRVIKMLPRTDVRPELIAETNAILKRHLGRNLFSNMTIQRSVFRRNRGGYHPVQSGQLDLLRGLFGACKTFGF